MGCADRQSAVRRKLAALTAVFSLLLAGCFTGRGDTITLGIFAGSAWQVNESVGYELLDGMISRFEQEHPGVQVVYESGILADEYESWLADKVIMGEVPDVFVVMGEDLGQYASLGLLKNLDPYLRRDKEIQESLFYPAAWEGCTYHYSQYALPYLMNPSLMFVNVSLLEKEGVAIPDGSWTLDDFEAAARAVTKDTDGDGVIDQFGCTEYGWLDLADAYGLQVFEESGHGLQLDAARPVLEQYRRLRQYMGRDRESLLEAGKAAFSPMSYVEFVTYNTYPWKIKKYTGYEWMCVPMPDAYGMAPRYAGESLLLGMNARTRQGELAWELMKTLCADENSQAGLLMHCQGFSARKLDESVFHEFKETSGLSIASVESPLYEAGRRVHFSRYEQARAMLSERMEKAAADSGDLDLALIEIEKEMQLYLQN